MKKATVFLLFCFAGFSTFAQIQRKVTDTIKVTGTAPNAVVIDDASLSKKRAHLNLVKELNLTREQKGKLREMRQGKEVKRALILNDGSLTEDQKQAQLQAIKRSGAVDLQGILTATQKKKMKEMLKERKNGDNNAMMIDE